MSEAFIRAHTTIARAPLVPEIALHLATEITPIWQAIESWLEREGIAPPYWAFAWPGSQGLARMILDDPALVRGRRVLDFAAGGGLAAIAAMLAGAASADAAEIDPLALAACRLNAALAGVLIGTDPGDVLAASGAWEVILAGDVCYEAPMAARVMAWLRAAAAGGALVLLADPGRAYAPTEGLQELARFTVPVTRELEDRDAREVTICRVAAGKGGIPSLPILRA
ncbi:putative nicotinamide N-methyase [Humitalea rosea]|uniref:Putative nicotinamide N-methyase n=1 Tax=Humitalea rosea TaxID=990373 RepID=A0A2W7I4S7_9PROT|nr:50S ribosomal protein L11 methyltransferase [Humitalea rosea]PZW41876.1 putative nicotinamide N-methyase [Humitalea rosea]